jgi:anti-anti-sigma factor
MLTTMDALFHVFKTGKLTVIGFDGRRLSDPAAAQECRERLLRLVDEHDCEVLVVDLMDVGVVSSWVLGILAAVKSHGVRVELYHPSGEIRNVLSSTHLDELLHIRHEGVEARARLA